MTVIMPPWMERKFAEIVAAENRCPGCDGTVSGRYEPHGVCQNCYGTTDDPHRDERKDPA